MWVSLEGFIGGLDPLHVSLWHRIGFDFISTKMCFFFKQETCYHGSAWRNSCCLSMRDEIDAKCLCFADLIFSQAILAFLCYKKCSLTLSRMAYFYRGCDGSGGKKSLSPEYEKAVASLLPCIYDFSLFQAREGWKVHLIWTPSKNWLARTSVGFISSQDYTCPDLNRSPMKKESKSSSHPRFIPSSSIDSQCYPGIEVGRTLIRLLHINRWINAACKLHCKLHCKFANNIEVWQKVLERKCQTWPINNWLQRVLQADWLKKV